MVRDALGRAFSQGRSLTSLERKKWPPPKFGSHLVIMCHRLRDLPVESLDVEGLRMLIGQNIGLTWLIPLALAKLEDDPFVSGAFYRGDLLHRVFSADPGFYDNAPAMVARARRLHALARSRLDALDDLDCAMVERILRKAPDRLKG